MALEVTAGTSLSSLGITEKNVSHQIIRPLTVNKKRRISALGCLASTRGTDETVLRSALEIEGSYRRTSCDFDPNQTYVD